MRVVSLAEVAQHNTVGDAWVCVEGLVYDVSKFAALHPGGRQVLQQQAGADATAQFRLFHAPSVLQKYKKLVVGQLEAAARAQAMQRLFSHPPTHIALRFRQKTNRDGTHLASTHRVTAAPAARSYKHIPAEARGGPQLWLGPVGASSYAYHT